MQELIFATGNPAKLDQMAFVIKSLEVSIQLVAAHERFGERAYYVEQGRSAAAIAETGAATLAQRLDVPVMVEDTTLHVESLDGRPGSRAGRYLKEQGRSGLLQELEGLTKRKASIVSAVAWAAPNGAGQVWVTSLEGIIAEREYWTPGMPSWVAPTDENPLGGGYNAIFIPIGSSNTLAQIPPEDAIQLGYREPNFCAVIDFLTKRTSRKT